MNPVKTAHALATAAFAVACVLAVVVLVSLVAGGDSLTLPFQISPARIHGLPRGVRLAEWPDVELAVHHPSTKLTVLHSAQSLGPLALVLAGLWMLRGFLRAVLDGDPFGPANVRRLRAIGFILVVGAPAVALLNYTLRQALYNDVAAAGSLASEGFAVPGTALLGGLGAFVLAEVFAYGLRLREDVEGTI